MLKVLITYIDSNATKIIISFKEHGSRTEIENVLKHRYNIEQNQIQKIRVIASSDDIALNALITKIDWEYLYEQSRYDIAKIINIPTVEAQILTVWLHVNKNMAIDTAVTAVAGGIGIVWESDKELFGAWKKAHNVSDYLSDFVHEDEALHYAYPSRAILEGGQVITLNQ